jgi:hypothetical protein
MHGLVAGRDIAVDRRPSGETKAGVHLVGEGETACGEASDAVVAVGQSPALSSELHARLEALIDAIRGGSEGQCGWALSDAFTWQPPARDDSLVAPAVGVHG